MLDNYNYGLDCSGGVIAVGSCAKQVAIDNNFIRNRNASFNWSRLAAFSTTF